MDNLSLKEFAAIVNGRLSGNSEADDIVKGISTDSRIIQQNSVFFSLRGTQHDGHEFIAEAINNGAVAAVVSQDWFEQSAVSPEYQLIIVSDPLEALHLTASWRREKFAGKVIAITGSNGKTIVKDALVHLLNQKYHCFGNPGSFNSQIGVPLSIMRIPNEAHFAVLEAGVSEVGEMSLHERILRPDYGILTNIGLAHISSFIKREAIAEEKVKLFRNLKKNGWLLLPPADPVIEEAIKPLKLDCDIYHFGHPQRGKLPYIRRVKTTKQGASLTVQFPKKEVSEISIKTFSREVITNIEIAICAGYLLGAGTEEVERAFHDYTPGITRMEVWQSPTGITLINDACSSDPISVMSSLQNLSVMKNGGKGIFVFGGMRELGSLEREEHEHIGDAAAECKVDTLILVGDQQGLEVTKEQFKKKSKGKEVYHVKFPGDVKNILLKDKKLEPGDTILLKGPRNTGIDRIAAWIIEAMAPNRFYVDLQKVNENILQFQRAVGNKTKIMAMVKALAYGSDAGRLSAELQFMGIEYFGVASADEGKALRKAGVDQNVLVMMCTPDEVDKLIEDRLIPMIYSFDIVQPVATAARRHEKVLDVHIEIDTGMGRLGVRPEEAVKLVEEISNEKSLHLAGLMTHFACAEDPQKDEFTQQQIQSFIEVKERLKEMGVSSLICHAAATAGSVRFPQAAFDMVRIGLGMYGIYPSSAVKKEINLDLAIALVSRVIEIRELKKGDTIGYGGTFTVERDNYRVGVVPIGYHDGVPLNLSGKGKVKVNGKESQILGRISMDSMIIDLSDLPDVGEGVDVLIFGAHGGDEVRPEDMAETAETISYELLARLGPRIQRIFITSRGQESSSLP
ncbi:MAG: alanine racemase [Pyrinomonadaceae bacterium]|nr:alanine racemase [Pyrinomonadaceae bacterium]